MDYSVCICSPHNYPHSQCFNEVALALAHGLKELGHDATISTRLISTRKNIILGGQLLDRTNQSLPLDSIIYNLEQVSPDSPWLTSSYAAAMKMCETWDYCQSNIEALEKIGIKAKLCRIGYVPALTRIPKVEEDIDVLFYGCINPRRQRVFDELRALGIEPVVAFNVYGAELDSLIARAKVVLNVHFYESKTFEIVRCSYLMANRKFIVSETGNDKNLEEPFRSGIAFTQYEDLAFTCASWLKLPLTRAEIAKNGFDIFSGMEQSTFLKEVL